MGDGFLSAEHTGEATEPAVGEQKAEGRERKSMALIVGEERQYEGLPIDSQAFEHFLSFCTRRQLRKKTVIVRAGDPADTLYYIVKGSATVIVEDEEDNEIVVAYLNAGDFIGETGLFYRAKARDAIVRTRTACELAEIKYDRLNQLFAGELKAEHAQILHAVGLQLSERLLKTTRRVSRLAFMDVAGRIARSLLDMCSEPDAMSHPDGTQIHLSRQELARIVGCSREVAGRVLKHLHEEGMITVAGMDIVVHHSR